MSDLTREIKVYPGYDHRDEPGDQRGAGGASLVLIVRGELGAIAAKLNTGWMARPVIGLVLGQPRPLKRHSKPGVDWGVRDCYPSGAYLGAHSYEPREGMYADGPCGWLESAVCYGTGGFLASDRVLELLVTGGSDAAFEHMAGLYQSWIVECPVVAIGGAS